MKLNSVDVWAICMLAAPVVGFGLMYVDNAVLNNIGGTLILVWVGFGILNAVGGLIAHSLGRGIGSQEWLEAKRQHEEAVQQTQRQNKNQYVPHGFDQQPLDSRLDPVGLYLKSLRGRPEK
jgi:hypothetical protein